MVESDCMRKTNINIELFKNITLPEVSYILGLLWADGCIQKDKRYNSYITSLTIADTDFQEIKHLFLKTGGWSIVEKRKHLQSKTLFSRAANYDPKLYEFLYYNGYNEKSGGSFQKIVDTIPDNLRYLFFRGLIDGDGCIFVGQRERKDRFISIASAIHQDWSCLINLSEKIGFNYSVKKNITSLKNGKEWKNSEFVIGQTYSILKFGNYIYQNFDIDKIGLYRKYDKFKQIVKLSDKMKIVKRHLKDADGKLIMENLVGQRFNHLLVINEANRNIHNHRQWSCECDCGNKIIVEGFALKGGQKSCGCKLRMDQDVILKLSKGAKKRFTIHGDTHNKFYNTWSRLKNRFTNKNNPRNKLYEKLNYKLEPNWLIYEGFKKDNYKEYVKLYNDNQNKISFVRKNKQIGFIRENCYWHMDSSS